VREEKKKKKKTKSPRPGSSAAQLGGLRNGGEKKEVGAQDG